MSVIHVDIVSATEEIYSGDANCVFAPATMGEIGVYPQHVPLISTLKPGEVRVETENGVESIYVSGGIVEVQPHTVTIFSDTAIRANDLDEAALKPIIAEPIPQLLSVSVLKGMVISK